MSYRNSVKLLISNFALVWKQLLYTLIIGLLCFGLAYATLVPTINLLQAEGVTGEFSAMFETIYTAPGDLISASQNALSHLFTVLKNNPSTVWAGVLCAFLFGYVVFNILKYVSYYNVTYVMHMKMTSFVDVGYTRSLISNLTASFRYACARLVYSLPFAILKTTIVIIYLKCAINPLSIVLGLFIASTMLIMVQSLETSFFVAHAPLMIDKNGEISAFKAFLIGNKTTLKNYPRIISNAIVVSLSIVVLNIFLGIFTVGAGLFITIPLSVVFKCIFDTASYLGACGERYYVSENTIAVSKENKITSKD